LIPKSYEVVVQGTLSPTLVAAFPGFDVARVDHGATHLIGCNIDQSTLYGLLAILRGINADLVSISAQDGPPGAGEGSPNS
jgi:hypothetical protein